MFTSTNTSTITRIMKKEQAIDHKPIVPAKTLPKQPPSHRDRPRRK